MRVFGAVLIIALMTLGALEFSRVGAGQNQTQGCFEPTGAPVLQDSGWTHYAAGNYSDYAIKYVEPSILKSGSTYVIYVREELNGSTVNGIFRGTSKDGVSWNMSAVPVLSPGAPGTWDDQTVFSPDVVWNGTGYLMYYVADGDIAPFPQDWRQVGVAFSADGIHWTKSSDNPVVTHGPGLYDARFVRGPSVIFDSGVYKMWYQGTAQLNATIPLLTTIEYATSTDGVHWTKYSGNPVFTGFKEGTGNYTFAYWPSVSRVNGTYYMAFGDGGSNLGFAYSFDGVTWIFDNRTSVLLSLSGWHSGFTGDPSMFIDGNRLLLWFHGTEAGNQTSPYIDGVGFAACGALIVLPPKTTTSTISATVTQVSTSISTSIISLPTTTTSFATTTQPVTDNPTLAGFQAAAAFSAGLIVALAIALALVWRKVRVQSSRARSAA